MRDSKKLKINNIKCRFTINPQRCISESMEKLSEYMCFKRTGNITTLRFSDVVYILFGFRHINLTGARSFYKLKQSVDLFLIIFSIYHTRKNIKIIVDNISASTNLGRPFTGSIESLKNEFPQEQVTFNQNGFPGIRIKTKFGSLLLFSTGRISVIGLKNQKGLTAMNKVVDRIRAI